MTRSRLPRLVCFAALFALGACQAVAKPASTTTNPTITASPTAAAVGPAAAPVALYACTSRTVTWDGKSAIDLTGTWAGDDQGVYYLRQLGDQVWWLGMSGLGQALASRGTEWTNVYLGTLKGSTITGTYADVPQGRILDKGPVVLKLTSASGGGLSLVRTDPVLETGFGGSRFTPCRLG
jgi:hypothetical protein